MADLPCPKCGRPSRGVCTECYLDGHPFLGRPEGFRECVECGLTFFKGKWYEDLEEMLREVAKRSIVASPGVGFKVLDVRWTRERGKIQMEADVQGSYADSSFRKTVKWEAKPERMTCESCKRLGSGYYEAILQVRDEMDFHLDPKQVSGVEKVKGGHDYYLVSMDYARQKVSELVDKGFLVKTSSKLYGKKNGKDVFRMYYSLKRPAFEAGDFLEYGGSLYRAKEIGKAVRLLQLPSLKQTSITMHRLADAKVVGRVKDVGKALVTSIRPDGMQVMDSQSGETFEAPLKEGLKQGQEVEYIRLKERMYVL